MKALSIQQPSDWLIVSGYKDVGNRDWPTRVHFGFRPQCGPSAVPHRNVLEPVELRTKSVM